MRLGDFVIHRNKPVHIAWWAAEFNVSEQALLAALDAVGERADAVRTYLDEQVSRTAAPSSTPTTA